MRNGDMRNGFTSNISCLAISAVLLQSKGHSVKPLMLDLESLPNLDVSSSIIVFDFPNI